MKVFFKFKPGTDERTRRQVAQLLRDEGATTVRRLFPRMTEANLRDLYVAEAETRAVVNRLISVLRAEAAVAFAHREVIRRPP